MSDQQGSRRDSPLYPKSIAMLERLRAKGLVSGPFLAKAHDTQLSGVERNRLLSIVELEIDGPGFDTHLVEPNAYGRALEDLAIWLSTEFDDDVARSG